MADISAWDPINVQRLVDAQSAEIQALRTERDTFRDAYRREVARNAASALDEASTYVASSEARRSILGAS